MCFYSWLLWSIFCLFQLYMSFISSNNFHYINPLLFTTFLIFLSCKYLPSPFLITLHSADEITQKISPGKKWRRNGIPYSLCSTHESQLTMWFDILKPPEYWFNKLERKHKHHAVINFILQWNFKIHSSKLAKECANLPEIYLKSYVVNGKFCIK